MNLTDDIINEYFLKMPQSDTVFNRYELKKYFMDLKMPFYDYFIYGVMFLKLYNNQKRYLYFTLKTELLTKSKIKQVINIGKSIRQQKNNKR